MTGFEIDEEGGPIILCPKCKNRMNELDQGEMTEGQEAD